MYHLAVEAAPLAKLCALDKEFSAPGQASPHLVFLFVAISVQFVESSTLMVARGDLFPHSFLLSPTKGRSLSFERLGNHDERPVVIYAQAYSGSRAYTA